MPSFTSGVTMRSLPEWQSLVVYGQALPGRPRVADKEGCDRPAMSPIAASRKRVGFMSLACAPLAAGIRNAVMASTIPSRMC